MLFASAEVWIGVIVFVLVMGFIGKALLSVVLGPVGQAVGKGFLHGFFGGK